MRVDALPALSDAAINYRWEAYLVLRVLPAVLYRKLSKKLPVYIYGNAVQRRETSSQSCIRICPASEC